MAKSQKLTEAYESLPKIAKVLLQLFLGAIVGGIYRIIRYTETKNLTTLIVGILATFTGIGNAIAWIVDLITLIFKGGYTVCAD